MKVLIISGTPKTKGITFSYVEAAEEAAMKAGAEIETITLSKMNLHKCKMCDDGWGICYSKHVCVVGNKDGFNDLQEKIGKADAFVFITPVYWSEVSEEMKLFIDRLRRCQATKKWDNEAGASFLTGKPSILVAVAGGSGGGIVNTFNQMQKAIEHMEGNNMPHEREGIFDYIGVNRWNQDYKREAMEKAIAEMIAYKIDNNKKAPYER